jgi:hypothetical protein
MKLCECTHGKIIVTNDEERVGMIVGITTNRNLCSMEDKKGIAQAIPLVKWSDAEFPAGIHQGNIKPLKGF